MTIEIFEFMASRKPLASMALFTPAATWPLIVDLVNALPSRNDEYVGDVLTADGEATIVQRGRVDGELRVGFVAGKAPAIASLMF